MAQKIEPQLVPLVQRYQQTQSESDFEEILKLTHSYRTGILGKFFVSGSSHEDLDQEMLMVLPDIIMTHTPGKSFSAWCRFRWRRAIITILKQAQNNRNKTLLEATSIHNPNPDFERDDSYIYEPNSREADPEVQACNKDNFNSLKNKVLADCTKMEAKVFVEYLKNKSYAEISKACKINEKAVDNALLRIKNRIIKQSEYKDNQKWLDELY